MTTNRISRYDDSRRVAFRRLVLTQRLRALCSQAEGLTGAALETLERSIRRHREALAADADLVNAIAPQMLSWAA